MHYFFHPRTSSSFYHLGARPPRAPVSAEEVVNAKKTQAVQSTKTDPDGGKWPASPFAEMHSGHG